MTHATRPIDETIVADLRAAVTGDVITPSDEGYDEARTLWNAAIDRRPAAIVRATSTDDVAAAIAATRDHDLPLSIRGGGHHVTGSALVDDGVVVDLSQMTDVAIDPEAKTARVGPGARVADVLGPAQEYGLAPVAGSAAQTGMAGSTLAGGIGWIRRKFGLGVDALRSVEVVTVNGDVLTASAGENPDLFWAVRGAGANVGVVTAFELDLVEVGPEVAIAQVAYPAEMAREVSEFYREFTASAPDEVTSLLALMTVPPLEVVPEEAHGAPIAMIYAVYAGPVDEGEDALAAIREFGEPIMDTSGPMPLAAVHEVARELFPDGRHYSWHSLYVDELSDEAIAAMVAADREKPTPECEVGFWDMGGAIAAVDGDETAFGFRDVAYMLSIEAAWEDPADADACVEWARSLWETLRDAPGAVDGFYAGFPGFVEGEERARMAYGDNLDRLAEVKAEYDPENLLRSNLNVEPAAN